MFLRIILAAMLLCLLGCSDFIHPVKSTPEPESEYAFNYWLLQKVYLYEDRLADLPKDGDSDSIQQQLYSFLEDPYTTYTPPSKSEAVITIINTSLVVGGDIGMRYITYKGIEHPIYINRVYAKSPAGRANVPRYGNILKANGIELSGDNAKSIYDSIVDYSKNIDILVAYNKDTTLYKLQKETVYAPTVFVDTLFEDSDNGYPGIIFVTIEGFKPTTADQKLGTYGEIKTYLDSASSDKRVRVLDLRNNPGGHVEQCIKIADLFSKKGTLSSSRWRTITADGGSTLKKSSSKAKAGDPGESGQYLILGNRASASCAEIFIAAVTETTDIPFVGMRTFGKGIGQTTYKTYAGGLAKITDLEFITPKGNSYHGKGIIPQYECEGAVNDTCAAKIANKLYGVNIPTNDNESLAKRSPEYTAEVTEFEGGAIEWADSSHYLETFINTMD